ncbi:hypothetical protein BRD13_01030 [Halobacteriales archaeon SW_5_70_135]|nr:MAG: hypothetical protein BRD13_01030 [Halobacteriales archaeon SW_5_70_135]
MDYGDLVDVYERLTATDADTEKRAILAETLADADGDRLPLFVKLLRGNLFAAHRSDDLGVSSSLTAEAVAKTTGVSPDAIEEDWKETGDLGGAAERAVANAPQETLFSESLTVERVHDELRALAGYEGEGSERRRVDAVAGLVADADPVEAKYVVRTALGHLRIGVGEGTVRDALADAFLDGSPAAVDAVERAYQVTNDYTLVAETARDEGREGLDALDVELFRPVGAMLAVDSDGLADGVESVADDPEDVLAESKYDGARCVSGFTPVYTRSGMKVMRDLQPGEKVLTHTGRFRTVQSKNRRAIDSDERVFSFSTYLGETFKITEGHELLVARSGGDAWLPVEKISGDDWVVFPLPSPEVDDSLSEPLVLSTTGNYTKEFDPNERFFRFLGYWVGDGTSNRYNRNRRVGLMFNNDDPELREEYREIVTTELGISPENVCSYDHGGATELYWTDRPMFEWLSRNFRKQTQDGWRDKRVPDWFWNLSQSQFEGFLRGWEEADGHVDDFGRRSVTTKERALASKMQLIGLHHDTVMGVTRQRIDGNTYYKLTITLSDDYARIVDDKIEVRILEHEELSRSSPREVDPRQKVYDIQVKGDESYCAPLLTLHNCQIHRDGDEVRVYTRRLEDVTEQFPDVVRAVREHVDADRALLDGEVVGYDPETREPVPFQTFSRRIRRKYDIPEIAEEIPVVVYLFDCLYLAGETLLDRPLRERVDRLESVLSPAEYELERAASRRYADGGETGLRELYEETLAVGHEGLMLKNLDAAYQPGRRVGRMTKVKPVMEPLDLVVTRARYSEGRRSSMLGRLYLACRGPDGEGEDDLREVGRLSTGYTDAELADLTDRLEELVTERDGREVRLAPEVVLEVAYEEIQASPEYDSGYALRFPRFERVREDLAPSNADTVERVERLYEEQ